jgi:hypothetical protein
MLGNVPDILPWALGTSGPPGTAGCFICAGGAEHTCCLQGGQLP